MPFSIAMFRVKTDWMIEQQEFPLDVAKIFSETAGDIAWTTHPLEPQVAKKYVEITDPQNVILCEDPILQLSGNMGAAPGQISGFTLDNSSLTPFRVTSIVHWPKIMEWTSHETGISTKPLISLGNVWSNLPLLLGLFFVFHVPPISCYCPQWSYLPAGNFT